MAQLNATTISGKLTTTGAIQCGGGLRTGGYIIADGRIYCPNNTGIRVLRNGTDPEDANTSNSNVLGFSNTSNVIILGHADNSARTEVRSPNYVALLCNGGTDYTGSYALRWYYYTDGSYCVLNPSTNNKARLGSASYKWSAVYAGTGTIQTSDRNLKRNIKNLLEDDRYIQLFDLIEPVSFQFTDGTRIHTGFISQDVEAAMEKTGLTDQDLAFFCKDIKIKTGEAGTADEGKEIPQYNEDGTPQYIYSLRYDEYIAIMAAKLKKTEARVDNKLKELEEKIKKLEEKMEA